MAASVLTTWPATRVNAPPVSRDCCVRLVRNRRKLFGLHKMEDFLSIDMYDVGYLYVWPLETVCTTFLQQTSMNVSWIRV